MLSEPSRAFFRKVLEGIGMTPGTSRPRLLDIGTGLGALLEEAQKLGYEAEGVDVCEPLVRKDTRSRLARALQAGRRT